MTNRAAAALNLARLALDFPDAARRIRAGEALAADPSCGGDGVILGAGMRFLGFSSEDQRSLLG